jgi:hypothetical protein
MALIARDEDGGRNAVTADADELSDAFAEWLRRYHEEPERFDDEYPDDEDDYGRGCATYLLRLLDELRSE